EMVRKIKELRADGATVPEIMCRNQTLQGICLSSTIRLMGSHLTPRGQLNWRRGGSCSHEITSNAVRYHADAKGWLGLGRCGKEIKASALVGWKVDNGA